MGFSDVKIRTKIIIAFVGVVVGLAVALAFMGYSKLRYALNQEFATRAVSDMQAFSEASGESMLIGDVDTVLNNMRSRLSGSDLSAILIYDVADDDRPYLETAEKVSMNVQELQRLISETSLEFTNTDLGGEISLGEFTRRVDATGQHAYAKNIRFKNRSYLIIGSASVLSEDLSDDDMGFDAIPEATPPDDDLLNLEGSEGEAPLEESEGETIEPAETIDLGADLLSAGSDEGESADAEDSTLARMFFLYDQGRIDDLASAELLRAFWIIVVAALISFILGWALARHLTRPIDDVVEVLKDIAEGEGDLSRRLNLKNKDEMGELATWFNTFVGKLNDLIGRMDNTSGVLNLQLGNLTENINLLQSNVNTTDDAFQDVSKVGDALTHSIGEISGGAETSYGEMEKVSEGADELKNKFSSVVANVEQSTANLNDIASAVEELSATFQEIARNMDHNKDTIDKAASLSSDASNSVRVLNEHAENIGDFVQIIDAISKQTNLLALNATIEAASAGEAGKGFAVVANEVKDLAKQTAQSVQQIQHRVSEIQESTHSTIDAIEEITHVMTEASNINRTVVGSIEEQATTMQEIHRNLDANSSQAGNISQAAKNSLDIAVEVSNACQSAFHNTTTVLDVSREILQHSAHLAEKSEQAQTASGEMVSALGSSYTSVTDLNDAAQSMMAITQKFKYINEEEA